MLFLKFFKNADNKDQLNQAFVVLISSVRYVYDFWRECRYESMFRYFFILLSVMSLLLIIGCKPGVQATEIVNQSNNIVTGSGVSTSTSETLNTENNNEAETTPLPTGEPISIPAVVSDDPVVSGNPEIVELTISQKDSNETTCSPLINDINDQHDRIHCGAKNDKCHTTYFKGTSVNLTAPLTAVCTSSSLVFRGDLTGFECNGSFLEVALPARTITFPIEENTECVAVYQ